MLSFLQNEWVKSIASGVLTGVIVHFFSKWDNSRKGSSRYVEQINNANIDIIRTLKPYIAEKGLPEKEIIDAIIVSTARKYRVKSEELYSIRIICEELIREIIGDVYVSSDKKQEYTFQLCQYIKNLAKENDKSSLVTDIEKEIKNLNNIKELNYYEKLTSALSGILSVIAALITTALSLVSTMELDGKELDLGTLIAAAVTIIACLIYSAISGLLRKESSKNTKTSKRFNNKKE